MGAGTRAVAYVRVSTDKQVEHGLSLEAQQAKLTAYATLYELDLVAMEVDAGVSAKTLQRPALQRALGTLQAGMAEALLVVKLDRLTRSVRDLGVLVETYFLAGKWSLMSVSEQIDTRTAAGRMVLNILAAVSQWERETIGERTAEAMAYKRQQREYTGGEPPYGWQLAADGVHLDPHTAEQAIVREALELKAAGLSLRKIGERLAARGCCHGKVGRGIRRRRATCCRQRWRRWRNASTSRGSGRLKSAWPSICASDRTSRHGRRVFWPATRRSRLWRI